MTALLNTRGEVCAFRMFALIAACAAFVGWLERIPV